MCLKFVVYERVGQNNHSVPDTESVIEVRQLYESKFMCLNKNQIEKEIVECNSGSHVGRRRRKCYQGLRLSPVGEGKTVVS